MTDWLENSEPETNKIKKLNELASFVYGGSYGSSGVSGTSGSSGVSGTSGTSGGNGESGLSGSSGVSGTSGSSGLSSPDAITIYTKTGLTYQLTLDDMGKYIIFNTGTTIYVPDSGTTNMLIGSSVIVQQNGVDRLTISPLNGSVVVNGNLKSVDRYNILVLFKIDINTWVCVGGAT